MLELAAISIRNYGECAERVRLVSHRIAEVQLLSSAAGIPEPPSSFYPNESCKDHCLAPDTIIELVFSYNMGLDMASNSLQSGMQHRSKTTSKPTHQLPV